MLCIRTVYFEEQNYNLEEFRLTDDELIILSFYSGYDMIFMCLTNLFLIFHFTCLNHSTVDTSTVYFFGQFLDSLCISWEMGTHEALMHLLFTLESFPCLFVIPSFIPMSTLCSSNARVERPLMRPGLMEDDGNLMKFALLGYCWHCIRPHSTKIQSPSSPTSHYNIIRV